MNTDIYNSFVYCWTNRENNKKYIGVHKGTPNDGYVCSSKLMLEDYNKNPESFVREIIMFGTFKDMHKLETDLLIQVNAAKNPSYYNQSNNDGAFYLTKHTEQSKEKIRQSKKKILDLYSWKCKSCNKEHTVLNTVSNRKRQYCNRQCQAIDISAKMISWFCEWCNQEHSAPNKSRKNMCVINRGNSKKTIWSFPDGRTILVEDTRKMCEQLGLSYAAVRHKIGKGPYEQGKHKGLSISRLD